MAKQIIRPECVKRCDGDAGGMAKMIHRVSPADYMLSALESLYLPQYTLLMLFS